MPTKVRRGLWLLLGSVVAYGLAFVLTQLRDPLRYESWLEVVIAVPTYVGFVLLVAALVMIVWGLVARRRS